MGSTEHTRIIMVYRRDRRSDRRTVLLRDGARGSTLLVLDAPDALGALRAAARALAWCERRGWKIAEIEPFPWADEVMQRRANDGPPLSPSADRAVAERSAPSDPRRARGARRG
jgi:hypothetical protein